MDVSKDLGIHRAAWNLRAAAGVQQAGGPGLVEPAEAVKDADVVYLASPIMHILELMEQLPALVKREALITDAGSTKAVIRNGSTLTTHGAGGNVDLAVSGRGEHDGDGVIVGDRDVARGHIHLAGAGLIIGQRDLVRPARGVLVDGKVERTAAELGR